MFPQLPVESNTESKRGEKYILFTVLPIIIVPSKQISMILDKNMRVWPILGECTTEGRQCPWNGEVCMALISQPRTYYIWGSFLHNVFKTGPCPKGKACSPDGK